MTRPDQEDCNEYKGDKEDKRENDIIDVTVACICGFKTWLQGDFLLAQVMQFFENLLRRQRAVKSHV